MFKKNTNYSGGVFAEERLLITLVVILIYKNAPSIFGAAPPSSPSVGRAKYALTLIVFTTSSKGGYNRLLLIIISPNKISPWTPATTINNYKRTKS